MHRLLDLYHAKISGGYLTPDADQEKAALTLQRLQEELTRKQSFFRSLFGQIAPKGVYIYGGVGRGKSMLMDMFYSQIPASVPKRRVHFHAFMIETHDWMHERRAGRALDNLLPDYAEFVAANTRLLCFDEFHVTDVADAMILSRLFSLLFDHGVTVVATSNWPPDRLYEGGLQRERFLPFIALVKERMEIVDVGSGTDYRKEALQNLETYLCPLNAATREKADLFFRQLSGGLEETTENIRVKGRDIPVRAAGGVARFTFAQLCEQPHGAEDYLMIASLFHIVMLENIPRMGYDRNNEAKRLMTLIDVLYDARRRAIFTAEAPPEKLYHDSKYAYEFERTVSRLKEMQSEEYLSDA